MMHCIITMNVLMDAFSFILVYECFYKWVKLALFAVKCLVKLSQAEFLQASIYTIKHVSRMLS